MHPKRMIVVIFLAAGIAAVAGIAWAEGSGIAASAERFCSPPVARMIAGNIGRLLVLRSEIGITDEQKSKVRAVVKNHRSEIVPVAKAVHEKRKALRDLVLDKPNDQPAIRTAANELGKAIADASVVASRVVTDARKVLTPEQDKQIRSFRANVDKSVETWLDQIGQ